MDLDGLDRLARALAAAGTRHHLLSVLAAAPSSVGSSRCSTWRLLTPRMSSPVREYAAQTVPWRMRLPRRGQAAALDTGGLVDARWGTGAGENETAGGDNPARCSVVLYRSRLLEFGT
jgi:hypothetical protein